MIEIDQIYNEDCLEGMKRIDDASVDCIITDLPYGTTACQWDSLIPFEPLWEQYRRITKPNAAIALFGSEPFSRALRMSNIKEYRYDWVWDKQKGFGFANANKMPMKQHEIISVFYRRLPTYNPQKTIGKPYKCKGGLRHAVNRGLLTNRVLTDEEKADPTNIKNRSGIATFIRSTVDNKGDRFPGSIISVPREYHDIVHPTQKPVALLRYLVLTYTDVGGGSFGLLHRQRHDCHRLSEGASALPRLRAEQGVFRHRPAAHRLGASAAAVGLYRRLALALLPLDLWSLATNGTQESVATKRIFKSHF